MATSSIIGKKGHDVQLKSPLDKVFKCPFCNLLMRDAIQTYRGQRACQSCYYEAKEKQTNKKMCPIDGEPIEDNKIFKDNYGRREILQLPCYCNNKHLGCTWEGVVIDIENHLPECSFELTTCELCNSSVMRQNMNQHGQVVCPLRPMECDYCKGEFRAHTLSKHKLRCLQKPTDCPYFCGKHVELQELYTHVQSCSMITNGVLCPYQLVGCKWQYMPNSEDNLTQHMEIEARIHAALAISNFKLLKDNNEKMAEEVKVEQNLYQQLSKKLEEDMNEKMMMVSKISVIESKVNEVQKECVEMEEHLDNVEKKVMTEIKEINRLTQATNLNDVNKKLHEMQSQVLEVEKNLTQPTGGDGSSSMSDEVKNSIVKIEQLENGCAVLSTNLANKVEQLQLLEYTSYNGHQLWKIDNLDYRTKQAVTGKVSALHSPPCYQRHDGYKFCARLYLNGDGIGKGTHISLFFVLMKSGYDDLLQWPFTERVTFRLINPRNQDESMRESFNPDRNSSSFKKPTSDMNVASGCPLFILKGNLVNFAIDDNIFIETTISSN